MDAVDSGDESYDEPMSTEILVDIHDSSKSYLSVNRGEAIYKTCSRIKQKQTEWKGSFKYTQYMGNYLNTMFKAFVNEILQALPIFG